MEYSQLPLADRVRPKRVEDIVGQKHLIGPDCLLRRSLESGRIFPVIFWGPPGSGKTTLARLFADYTRNPFYAFSAVTSGVKKLRQIIDQAQKTQKLTGRPTILFVDEIHRFNKAQQDAFLHHVENGLIVLVGATTENPSFEVIPALVSRCRVFTLKQLSKLSIVSILKKALTDSAKGLGNKTDCLSDDALVHIANISDGDARIALTNLETAVLHFGKKKQISIQDVEIAVEKKSLLYDKAGEEHYNLISAFIKSMRGSDPDAAIYWLERMLVAGDDPYYMLRRMIRFATEDIGLADPGALTMALNASESFRTLGHPEGDDVLFQAAIYLATAPKSNAVYTAHKAVGKMVKETGYQPVPLHIRNAPTTLMKTLDYGKGYKYAHDHDGAFVPQSYLPKEFNAVRFYHPTQRGYEKIVKQRLDTWNKSKSESGPGHPEEQ